MAKHVIKNVHLRSASFLYKLNFLLNWIEQFLFVKFFVEKSSYMIVELIGQTEGTNRF